MKNKLVYVCDIVIKLMLYISCAGVAILFWPDSFELGQIKITVLQVSSTIIFTFWVIKCLEINRIPFSTDLKRILIPVLLFLISGIISYTVVSPYKSASFEELSLRIPYIIIFVVTISEFTDIIKSIKLMKIIVSVTVVLVLYGLIQHFGFDPMGWKGTHGDRVFSTFGNPNLYTGYLVMMVPLVLLIFTFKHETEIYNIIFYSRLSFLVSILYFILQTIQQNQFIRITFFFILFLILVITGIYYKLKRSEILTGLIYYVIFINIFIAASRSGYIGTGMSIISLIIFFAIIESKNTFNTNFKQITIYMILLLLIILSGVIYLNKQREKSISERKFILLSASDLIKKHPIIGNGLGTFKINYPSVRRVGVWSVQEKCYVQCRNVYNEFVEIVNDEGIIGLFIFLWLIGIIILLGYKEITSPEQNLYRKYYLAGLLSSVLGILVSNMFSLTMRYVTSGFYFWLLLGLLSAKLIKRYTENNNIQHRKNIIITFFQILVFSLNFVLIPFWIRFFLSDIYLNYGLKHSKQAYQLISTEGNIVRDIIITGGEYYSDPKEWEQAIKYYRKSLKLYPGSINAHYFLANSFNRRWNLQPQYNPDWGDTNGNTRTDAERALAEYEELKKQAPDHVEIHFEMATLYMKLGKFDIALEYLKKYIEQKPFFAKAQYYTGWIYMQKKEWEQSEKWYLEALNLNDQFTQAYIDISIVYYKQKKYDLFYDSYRKALELSPNYTDKAIAHLFNKFGDWDKAIEYYKKAEVIRPTDSELFYELGWCYIQKKEWQNAINSYKKAISLNDKFIMAYINLSNIYYNLGNFKLAKEMYKKALEIDPAFVNSIIKKHSR